MEAGFGVTAIETRLTVIPCPLKATVCGLLDALSVIVSVPKRLPVLTGAKLTDTVQFAPAPKVDGESGQLLLSGKSARLDPILLIVSAVA